MGLVLNEGLQISQVFEPSLVVAVVLYMPSNVKNSLSEAKDELWSPLVHHVTVKRLLCNFAIKNNCFLSSYNRIFPTTCLKIGVVFLNIVISPVQMMISLMKLLKLMKNLLEQHIEQ